jgi:hypothetical protein
MNKLSLFFCILSSIIIQPFFLSAYNKGIRPDRMARSQQIKTIEEKLRVTSFNDAVDKIDAMQNREITQTAQQEKDKLEIQKLEQDKQQLLARLDANSVAAGIKKIDHLLAVHEQAKNINPKVQALTNKMKA